MLAWPAFADDKPKDDPKVEKKEQSPKEQLQALQRELATKRQALLASINKAKGTERTDLIKKYTEIGNEFADKALKIAEDHPKDPVAVEALFFVLSNSRSGDGAKKALEKLPDLIAEIPARLLAPKLMG